MTPASLSVDSGEAPVWLVLTVATAGLLIALWVIAGPSIELLTSKHSSFAFVRLAPGSSGAGRSESEAVAAKLSGPGALPAKVGFQRND